jgi:hypothetical protein
VALHGKEPDDERGKFYVKGYCFQELPVQVARPLVEENKYVILMPLVKL